MSNKFKIRNLENEKRRIDKQIAKLKEEDLKSKELREFYISCVTEERSSIIKMDNVEKEVKQIFYYKFTREDNKVICELTDNFSKIKAIGVAICCEDDSFNVNVGCVIAERRAVVNYYRQVEIIETSRH